MRAVVDVVHQQAFGDFDVDRLVAGVRAQDRGVGFEKSALRNSRADRFTAMRMLGWCSRQRARCKRAPQHPSPDRHDQARFLEHGNEFVGRTSVPSGLRQRSRASAPSRRCVPVSNFGW
jgi:hypothetical protein